MIVQVLSSTGKVYEIPYDKLKISQLISRTLTDVYDDNSMESFPLPTVDDETLEYIIRFLDIYAEEPMNDIEKPIYSTELSDYVQPEYVEFMNSIKDDDLLIKITNSSNYMDIPPLLELTCAYIAIEFKKNDIGKIRDAVQEMKMEE